MNKKLIVYGTLSLVVVGLVAFAVFVVRPMITTAKEGEPEQTAYVDSSDEEAGEDMIPSDIGESSLDLFDADTDLTLGSELAVDLDSLTDDQRERILRGELTMEELQAELGNSSTPATTSDTWGDTADLGGVNFGDEALIDAGLSNDTVIDTNESVDGIQFGDPDVQTGTEVDSAEIPTIQDNSSAFVEEENTEPAKENTPVLDTGSSAANEVPAPETSDPSNFYPVSVLIVLFLAIICKVGIIRKGRLYD